MTPTFKPIYVHDCERCTYLGPYREGGTAYDLYHCMQSNSYQFPTVIARYSDDGPGYHSGMVFAESGLRSTLVEAKRRAVALGLPVQSEVTCPDGGP